MRRETAVEERDIIGTDRDDLESSDIINIGVEEIEPEPCDLAEPFSISLGQAMEELQGLGLPLLDEIRQDIEDTIKDREHSDNPFSDAPCPYNRIPAGSAALCQPVLLVYCFNEQEFMARLNAICDHAGCKCSNTEHIYFVTNTWMPEVWERFGRLFGRMQPQLTVLFHAMGRVVPLQP